MRHHRILLALAGAGLVLLPILSPRAGGDRQRPAFDPLFAQGASCAPAQPGRPVLLASLLQAQQPLQQAHPTETRPFQPGQQLPSTGEKPPPPLYGNLGKLHLAVTTNNPQAQAYFDQGLRLNFAFNHAEAVRAFRAAARLDPDCAMCHWAKRWRSVPTSTRRCSRKRPRRPMPHPGARCSWQAMPHPTSRR